MWGELPQACAPGTKGRRDDVILTGLDEESDSTNEEMPPLEPLEPLEGAAQLGEVWLCGHEKTDVIPSPRLSWRCSSGRRSWGMQLGGPQAGGAQPCGARLDVGLMD